MKTIQTNNGRFLVPMNGHTLAAMRLAAGRAGSWPYTWWINQNPPTQPSKGLDGQVLTNQSAVISRNGSSFFLFSLNLVSFPPPTPLEYW